MEGKIESLRYLSKHSPIVGVVEKVGGPNFITFAFGDRLIEKKMEDYIKAKMPEYYPIESGQKIFLIDGYLGSATLNLTREGAKLTFFPIKEKKIKLEFDIDRSELGEIKDLLETTDVGKRLPISFLQLVHKKIKTKIDEVIRELE